MNVKTLIASVTLGASFLAGSASARVLNTAFTCDGLVGGTGAGSFYIQTTAPDLIKNVRSAVSDDTKWYGNVRVENIDGQEKVVVGFRGGLADNAGYEDLPSGRSSAFKFQENGIGILTLRGGDRQRNEENSILIVRAFTNCKILGDSIN